MSLRRHLDSFIFYDDLRLNLPGYKLARADNLRNNKRGKVDIYFKETVAVWPVPINSLKESLLQEVFIGNEKDLYNHYKITNELYDFLLSLDQLLSNMISQNPIFLLLNDGFNWRNSSLWKTDYLTRKSIKMETLLICSFGSNQLLNDLTHFIQKSSSCIDSVFQNQPNFVTDSGVHPFLHPSFHN